MHNAASHAKGVKGQDEEVTKQIRYLAQGADSPIDVSNVLQEALGLLSEFPTFVPKLLGLQLPRRAAKQTVIGLIGLVDYYIGTQVHQLALTVIFSSLADPRRHFQLICPQQSLPFHLTDSTGRVVLDTCPHTNLLKTVRWFISVVERLLATNTSVVPSQMNTEDIWAATEGYRELCLIANQQYNALTADLGEKQRTVVEEVGSSRRRGSILASTATRLAKDMSVALEMLSDYHNKHDADEIATNCHASAGIPQPVQSNKARESTLRASETTRLLANLSAVDSTISDIISIPPDQEIPAVTSTMLRSVRNALGDLTEMSLNLRYAIYSMSQNTPDNQGVT